MVIDVYIIPTGLPFPQDVSGNNTGLRKSGFFLLAGHAFCIASSERPARALCGDYFAKRES